MSQTSKAMWLSALVFPGSGHWLLKKYKTAGVLIVSAGAAVYFLVDYTLTKAHSIAEKIETGEVGLDINRIMALITAPPPPELATYLSIATYVLMISWIIGIVDCYRIGTKLKPHHSDAAVDSD
jgi:hypothetical protein